MTDQQFTRNAANRHLHERLERAIRERGAFRYFKGVLLDYLAEGRAGSSSSGSDYGNGFSTDQSRLK